MSQVKFFGNTNIGMVRKNNEDAFVAQTVWDEKNILAVAIDGVGGYEGGEVASALAKQKIVEYLENYPNGERLQLLREAVIYANNCIFEERRQNRELSQMSCVLTAALVEVDKREVHMAHVGDTRLYEYCNGEISKLSHDHSIVGYREEIGELTEEEAMHHPQRNVISSDVGSEYWDSNQEKKVESATFALKAKSTLLLCSDGLCDMITSKQMKQVLEKSLPIEEKVQELIELANAAGGKDNVTVVLVEANLPEDEPISKPIQLELLTSSDTSTQKSKSQLTIVLSVLIALGVILGAVLAFFLLKDDTSEKVPMASAVPDSHEVVEYAESVKVHEEWTPKMYVEKADTLNLDSIKFENPKDSLVFFEKETKRLLKKVEKLYRDNQKISNQNEELQQEVEGLNERINSMELGEVQVSEEEAVG